MPTQSIIKDFCQLSLWESQVCDILKFAYTEKRAAVAARLNGPIYLRTKIMPSVPGPQWQEMVQPAVVS